MEETLKRIVTVQKLFLSTSLLHEVSGFRAVEGVTFWKRFLPYDEGDLFDKNNCLEGERGAKRSVQPVKTWDMSASFAVVQWS